MLAALVTATLCAPLVLALLAAPSAGSQAPVAAARPGSEPAAEREGLSTPASAGEGDDDPAVGAGEPRRRGWVSTPAGARPGLSWSRADDPVPERRFLLGVEGVVVQAPPLQPQVVRFDPRFLGRSTSLGGIGLLGRLQLHPRIGVEAVVRSGSVRYAGREDEGGAVVSQDQVMADLGVLLYVARGDIAQLAFDAGLGGMGTRVRYELGREGTQLYGSGLVRVGADVEFLTKRIAFVVSVRSYGVVTDRERVRQRGALLEGRAPRAPVATLQTFMVASAGVAYRF
jgi:hypothetical protein